MGFGHWKLPAVTQKLRDEQTQVIKPLTLDVADREFIVMVGPSRLREIDAAAHGCRAGAGDGREYLDQRPAGDRNGAKSPDWDRCSRTTRFIRISCLKKTSWGLKIRGMGKQQIAERVKEAARILELDEGLSAARASFPADERSVWRWAARFCAIRRCSC